MGYARAWIVTCCHDASRAISQWLLRQLGLVHARPTNREITTVQTQKKQQLEMELGFSAKNAVLSGVSRPNSKESLCALLVALESRVKANSSWYRHVYIILRWLRVVLRRIDHRLALAASRVHRLSCMERGADPKVAKYAANRGSYQRVSGATTQVPAKLLGEKP